MIPKALPARNECLDAAKGICILLVVMYHTFMYFISKNPQFLEAESFRVVQIVVAGLGTMRMPLFFLISGYLAHTAVFNRNWREIFEPRIAMMLWLYVLWVCLDWVFRDLMITQFNPLFVHGGEDFPRTLDAFLHDVVMGNTAIWYLYALVMYFSVCKIGSHHTWLTFSAFLLLSVVCRQLFSTDEWSMRSICGNAVFFCAGCYGKHYVEQITTQFSLRNCILAFAAFLLLGKISLRYDAIDLPGVRVLICACMVIASLYAISLTTRHLKLALLQKLGRYTLPIYVMHQFIIDITAQLILPIEVPAAYLNFSFLAALIGMIVLNTAICVFLYWILNRQHGRMLFALPTRDLFKTKRPIAVK